MRRLTALLCLLLMAGVLPAGAQTSTSDTSTELPDLEVIDPVRHSYDDAIRERHIITGRDGLQSIAFDLIRPDTTDPVPTIMVSSPYYNTNGRPSHDADGSFVAMRKTPWGEPSRTAEPTTDFPEQYDEEFVPRGYAVLQHDLRGSRNSSGCQVYGHRSEAEDAVDVINWVEEQEWSNGAVGMIGGSYDGTIANGAASMAPAALKAIVPIRAIDRWYDYHHFNGVLSSNFVTPFNFSTVRPLEDLQSSSGEDELYGLHVVERKACGAAHGPTVGAQYANPYSLTNSDFWDSRDYVKDAENVTAAVFIVHGLNDTNVKPMNASHLYEELPADVPKKLWWLRGAHDNPHDPALTFPVNTEFDVEVHRWFAQFLKGLDAGALDTPPVMVQDEEGTLQPAPRWPAASQDLVLHFGPGGVLASEPADSTATTSYRDDPVAGTSATLESEPLERDLRISGQPYVDLSYSLPQGGDTTFAYALQDYDPDAGHAVTITRAYARSAFRDEIQARGRSELTTIEPLEPSTAASITFPFWPADYVVPAGHTLRLVLDADDNLTQGGGNGTTNVLLSDSSLVIPDAATRDAEAALLQ